MNSNVCTYIPTWTDSRWVAEGKVLTWKCVVWRWVFFWGILDNRVATWNQQFTWLGAPAGSRLTGLSWLNGLKPDGG